MIAYTTRIAPSPTGMFHLGGARTALFNWLIARSTGGKFILRIDDTDEARNNEDSVQVIHDAMSWLGLDHDIYSRQSDRLDLYKDLGRQLISAGLAKFDNHAIRMIANADSIPSQWVDQTVGKVNITDRDRDSIDGLVLLRSDGIPTYHMSSVVDDMDLDVTWVVRGTEHLSNTPKQIVLWKHLSTLNWNGKNRDLPLFSHIGLITKDGVKLSKRDGAASLLQYRDDGINADAMFNWLLRLGWGPHVDDRTTRTISRDRALDLFLKGGKMRPSPANMDINLLNSLDRKYKAMLIKAEKVT